MRAGRTDGTTDLTKLTVACRKSANASNYVLYVRHNPSAILMYQTHIQSTSHCRVIIQLSQYKDRLVDAV